jgi:pilus assembly protein CpaF
LGEVRGQEAFDMLQAMNTGHEGSLTTIHANSPRDALMRLETMVAMTGMEIPNEFLRRYISSALDIIIQEARLADGTRKVVSIQEITGMEGNMVTLQEIFVFEQTGVETDGKIRGHFKACGIRPKFFERFQVMGIHLPPGTFDPRTL